MQLEQALDENDLVYHDTMIAASWRKKIEKIDAQNVNKNITHKQWAWH